VVTSWYEVIVPGKTPRSVLLAALDEARERLLGLPGVLAVGLARRQRRGRWGTAHVIAVYVVEKQDLAVLAEAHRIPRRLHLHLRGRAWEVPVDVIALGGEPGRTHGIVAVGGLLALPGLDPAGAVSWTVDVGGARALVTAEHVVGLGARGPVYTHTDHLLLGQVVRTAYAEKGHDAALVRLEEGWTCIPALVGAPAGLPPPRPVRDTDTGTRGRVFLPFEGAFVDVTLRSFKVTSLPFRLRDGTTFQPRDLVLTDPVTRPGDSGTVLLARDGSPVGLLTGLYVDPRTGAPLFSCFTELLPALSSLLG